MILFLVTALGYVISTDTTPVPITDTAFTTPAQDVLHYQVSAYGDTPNNPLENLGITLNSGSLVEGDVRMTNRDRVLAITRLFDGNSYGTNQDAFPYSNQGIKASAVIEEKEIWSNNIIPYVLDENLNETETHFIKTAIEAIMSTTGDCVEFVPRSTEPDFVYITAREKGCWSDIGRKGGNQTVSVSRASGCVTPGIIMHELMHSLGFGHEHTRPDRNNYIQILQNNILFDHLTDFAIRRNRKILVPEYDYYSLMHYKTTAFSKDSSRLKTIGILQNGIDESTVGQRDSLSEKDVLRIKLLYSCIRS